MIPIFLKEITLFLSSLIGYVAIVMYLLICGLFLWIYPDFSVLNYGYASLETFFYLSPMFFMFLIPAITMRSFSEEISTGTIELLVTRPLTDLQVILGKYFASLALVIIALIPTLFYYYSITELGSPKGNIDSGGYWGSFIGLIFLAAAFTAIGIFSSSITGNQIVAFISGVFLCFLCYLSFDFIAGLPIFFGNIDYFIEQLGINAHYLSLSKGVIDTRDVIYFLSLTSFFILLSQMVLESRKW